MRPTLKIGSQARLYKSYHGRHWARGVFKIGRKINVNKKAVQADPTVEPIYRYFANGRWLDRDEIMLISGVDAETEKALSKK